MIKAVPIEITQSFVKYGGRYHGVYNVRTPIIPPPTEPWYVNPSLEWSPEVKNQLANLGWSTFAPQNTWSKYEYKYEQEAQEKELLRIRVMPLPLILLIYLWCLTTNDGAARGLGFVLGIAGVMLFRMLTFKWKWENRKKARIIAKRETLRWVALGESSVFRSLYESGQCPYGIENCGQIEIGDEIWAAIEKYKTLEFFFRTSNYDFDIKENEDLDMDAVVRFKKSYEEKKDTSFDAYREYNQLRWDDLSEWKIRSESETT